MEKTEDEGLDDQTDLTVSKFSMLEYEKQIFIDVFEKDALLIMAKYEVTLLFIQTSFGACWRYLLCLIIMTTVFRCIARI